MRSGTRSPSVVSNPSYRYGVSAVHARTGTVTDSPVATIDVQGGHGDAAVDVGVDAQGALAAEVVIGGVHEEVEGRCPAGGAAA